MCRIPDEFNNLWNDPDHLELKLDLIKQNFGDTVINCDPGPARIGRY